MMELKDMHANTSDDEDLELLRLAALQSIKKPINTINEGIPKKSACYNGNNTGNHFHMAQHFNKKGRGYLNRNTRINPVNNRVRNTNLISIPTIDNGKSDKENFTPKLTLPQDRYTKNEIDKETEQSSKFNRYDNSDNSDSESESGEHNALSEEDELKLERSNSLEALMQELENEIQGDSVAKQQEGNRKPKVKKVKNKAIDNVEGKETIETTVKGETQNNQSDLISNTEINKSSVRQEEPKPVLNMNQFQRMPFKQTRPLMKKFGRQNNQVDVRPNYQVNKMQNAPYNFRNPPYINKPCMNQNVRYHPSYFNPINPNPVQYPVPIPINNYVPPLRPMSPLRINTERPNNLPMAPLSPRSAAFVLQNQKIIERRKKSPRRSYSPSPSPPRYRSSVSPRRSLSPRYTNRRSCTPVRKIKQISLSPRDRASPIKEKYNKQSTPISRRQSPKRQSRETSPIAERKVPVKERLGNRTEMKPQQQHEDSKLQEQNKSNATDESNSNNPILEARKKKFEAETVPKEGIIRLRKEDWAEGTVDEEPKTDDEDLLLELDDDVIDTNVDHLFSDEESDDENEGRFKLKSATTATEIEEDEVPRKRRRKSESEQRESRKSSKECSMRDRKSHSYRQRSRERKNYGRCEKKETTSERTREKSSARQRLSLKNNDKSNEKKPVTSPIENKKIEIKIRNPSKYEGREERLTTKTIRKVEIANKKLAAIANDNNDRDDNDELEAEIIIDNEDDVKDTSDRGGDLRAQISRKRAEKQKLPISENFKSRLLQNALEEVVYKQKSKKIKGKLDNKKDTRVPIRLRLGRSSGGVEKTRKKDLDQVSNFAFLFLAFIYQIISYTYIYKTILYNFLRCYNYLRCNASHKLLVIEVQVRMIIS